MTLSQGAADWVSTVSVANEHAAQNSNIYIYIYMLALAVCSMFQKPSAFPSSTCIDLLQGDLCMLYGGYFMHVICSSSISSMLTAACCGCIGSSKSPYFAASAKYQIYSAKTKYINFMNITMQILPRAVVHRNIFSFLFSWASCL